MTDRITDELLSRRTVTALATAGISLPLLAACGDDSGTDPVGSSGGTEPSADPNQSGGTGDAALAETSDVEVGGGTIISDEGVVITQPTEGAFKAFDATCTHQGCQVSTVSGGTINCACHGSKFSIEDGSPESGPATSPLKEVAITVSGDKIELA